MTQVNIEVTVEEIKGATEAQASGASRLEVCSALDLGGLTPSAGLLHTICEQVTIPVFAIVRPRSGNFIIDETDVMIAEEETRRALELGAAGIAWGALDPQGNIDTVASTRVIESASGRPVTFHRAFDSCCHPRNSLETLIELGFDAILTSGGAPSALEGADAIADLVDQARGRIEIIAAGKIHPANAPSLVAATGIHWLHLSARKTVSTEEGGCLDLAPRSVPGAGERAFTDPEVIQELRGVLDRLPPPS